MYLDVVACLTLGRHRIRKDLLMSEKIKVAAFIVLAGFIGACGGDGGQYDQIACAILSPADGVIVGSEVDVTVAVSGPVAKVQLLTDGRSVAEQAVPPGSDSITLTWESSQAPDGQLSLVARAMMDEGIESRSEPVTVVVDNTQPRVSFDMSRMDVVTDEIVIPLVVEEDNLVSIRVVDRESQQELLSSQELVTGFAWDTTGFDDGMHHLTLQVVDAAGNTGRVDDFPVVVANYGEEVGIQWIGNSEIFIPENWQQVEYHLRASATSKPGISRVLSWLTWDGAAGWTLNYDLGQGLCPHHGINYTSQQSDSGEIVIDLSRADLPPEIVSQFPTADQDSSVFPYNTDQRTFGAFFGHIVPLSPDEHINESLAVEIRFVFFYEQD